jgi:hypothetical protein
MRGFLSRHFRPRWPNRYESFIYGYGSATLLAEWNTFSLILRSLILAGLGIVTWACLRGASGNWLTNPQADLEQGRETNMTISTISTSEEKTRGVRAYQLCCDELSFALKQGFLILDSVYEEVSFPPVSIKEAGGTIGNILTGETYDPEKYFVGLGVVFCPLCGTKLGRDEDD